MNIKNAALVTSCSLLSFSTLAADDNARRQMNGSPSFSALLNKFEDQKQSVISHPINKVPSQAGVPQKKASDTTESFMGHPGTAPSLVKLGVQKKAETTKKDGEPGTKSNSVFSQDQKTNFLIREAMIDECVNQYIVLKSPELTYGQLTSACLTLYPLYDRRRDFNSEKGLQDKLCDNVCNLWWFSESSRQDNERDNKGSRFRHNLVDISIEPVGQHWYDLVCKIKEDIIESMDMYERLYGAPHSRKDEFLSMNNRKLITVDPFLTPKDEPKAATPSSLTLKKQQELNALREEMIDECINQYKVLTKEKLKKGDWVKACKKLYPLYDKRREYTQEQHIDYSTLRTDGLTTVGCIFRHIDSVIRATPESKFKEKMDYYNAYMQDFLKFKTDIRNDIAESIEMYESTYGKTHPRKAEFLKM